MAWRVGLLMPSANAVMEGDLHRGLPHDASLHVGRMYLRDATRRSQEQMLERFAIPTAMVLKTVAPDLVLFDGAGAPCVDCRNYEQELGDEISRVTGTPVIGVRSAILQALRRAQCHRLTVVTPHGDSFNSGLKTWLEREGFEVTAIYGMGVSYVDAALVTPEAVLGFIQSSVGPRVSAGGLFVAGTNLQAIRVLSLLEMTYEVPVMTSNLAALHEVKRRLSELRESKMAPRPQLSS